MSLTAPRSTKGTYTQVALQAKVEAKAAHDAQLALAVVWCAVDGNGGPAKAAKEFDGLSRGQIALAIAKSKAAAPPREAWRILTDKEEKALVKWLLASAKNDNPAIEAEVSEKVREILLCRRLFNRKKGNDYRQGCVVALSEAELRIAINDGDLSHTWFMKFYAKNPSCHKKTAHKQEAKRVSKQREDVVERHFNGEFGLSVSLTLRGIMDEDGNLVDKRRLINGDEMPAFLDFLVHNLKAIGEAGVSLQRSGVENRECATVNMAGDAGGFVYGPQFIAARSKFQGAYGDCTEPWEAAEDYGELSFDDKIYLLEQRSTFSLVSLTKKGVQTGVTFAEFLHFLRKQIDARNRALVR